MGLSIALIFSSYMFLPGRKVVKSAATFDRLLYNLTSHIFCQPTGQSSFALNESL